MIISKKDLNKSNIIVIVIYCSNESKEQVSAEFTNMYRRFPKQKKLKFLDRSDQTMTYGCLKQ